MTYEQFEAFYREEILPGVVRMYERNGRPDYPARREAWNDTVDMMVQDGDLPAEAEDWALPDELDG